MVHDSGVLWQFLVATESPYSAVAVLREKQSLDTWHPLTDKYLELVHATRHNEH